MTSTFYMPLHVNINMPFNSRK